MAKPGKDEEPPIGIKSGKKRKVPEGERIAARVARFADNPPVVLNVMALNPGFFQLERMRASASAKKRGKARKKVRGK